MNRAAKFWLLVGIGVLLDQAVKAWVRGTLGVFESLSYPWPGVFEITLTYNKGVAFGMLQGLGVYLMPIAVGICVLAYLYSVLHPQEPRSVHVALALVTSGAIGNLIDRAFLGKVTDMFWFRLIDFPVFNVADSLITIGTALLILHGLRESFFHKETPAAVQNEAPPAPTEARADSPGQELEVQVGAVERRTEPAADESTN